MPDTPADLIRRRLHDLYGEQTGAETADRLFALLDEWKPKLPSKPADEPWSQKDALLITYGDSIRDDGEAPLATLDRFLTGHVGDRLSMVHLLPFYPWTSDDGFSVTDFRQVSDDLGDWPHIRRLAEHYKLVFDGVINHVSQESQYVRGFLADEPRYADFCIALPPDTDTSSVLRTRNLPLLHDYQKADGETVYLWTTFSRDQVDLNFHNPDVLLEIVDILLFFAANGASCIRLDAIPYLWKELGTSCAHLPQTHQIIKLFRDVYDLAAPHVLLLTETNVPHHENISYFGHAGDEAQIIYNFSLAPLILWSLISGDASTLTDWARQIDHISDRATYLNITATHDGIGMRPTEGILSEAERQQLVDLAHDHHGDVTGKRNSDGSISPYELNLNYFDAVNHPDADEPLALQIQRFLLSQAIPLSFIGIPGIYIHSLLGSRNDLAGVQRTGRARSINREILNLSDLESNLADATTRRATVFNAYNRLLDIRAHQPAFHPNAKQTILDLGPNLFALRRERNGQTILALHNVTPEPQTIPDTIQGQEDLLGHEEDMLNPYEFRWMVVAIP